MARHKGHGYAPASEPAAPPRSLPHLAACPGFNSKLFHAYPVHSVQQGAACLLTMRVCSQLLACTHRRPACPPDASVCSRRMHTAQASTGAASPGAAAPRTLLLTRGRQPSGCARVRPASARAHQGQPVWAQTCGDTPEGGTDCSGGGSTTHTQIWHSAPLLPTGSSTGRVRAEYARTARQAADTLGARHLPSQSAAACGRSPRAQAQRT